MMIYHSKKGTDAWMRDRGFITVKEYAKLTKTKLPTVYKKIARGKIPHEKIGGTIYINVILIPELKSND